VGVGAGLAIAGVTPPDGVATGVAMIGDELPAGTTGMGVPVAWTPGGMGEGDAGASGVQPNVAKQSMPVTKKIPAR
jgi:hypothetical protein